MTAMEAGILERATKKEVREEVQRRMKLLKFHPRMFKHWQEGTVYYSYIYTLKPLTAEMKKYVSAFSRGNYEPYHVMFSDTDSYGRILYVLCVYYDMSNWDYEREQLTQDIELPCEIIYLDKKKHEKGTALLFSIAEDARIPEARIPITVEWAEETEGPSFRNLWRAMKSMFS